MSLQEESSNCQAQINSVERNSCRRPESMSSSSKDQLFCNEARSIECLQSEITTLKRQHCEVLKDNNSLSNDCLTLRNRVNFLEENKLKETSEFNNVNNNLEKVISQIKTQLEKCEADKQDLGFNLTDLKRKFSEINKKCFQKESDLSKQITTLSDEKASLLEEVRELKCRIDFCNCINIENEKKIIKIEEEKKAQIEEFILEETRKRDDLEKENNNLKFENRDLKMNLDDFEFRLKEEMEENQKARMALKNLLEKEKSLYCQNQEMHQVIQSLKDELEYEKSKSEKQELHSEIYQIKEKELESLIERHKQELDLVSEELEQATSKCSELENCIEAKEIEMEKLKCQLKQSTKSHNEMKTILEEEINSKKKLDKNTSSQLDDYQNQLAEMKQELEKSKKEQNSAKEKFANLTLKLRMLINTFKGGDTKKKQSKGSKTRGSQEENPQTLIDTLKSILENYQKENLELKKKFDKKVEDHEQDKHEIDKLKELLESRKNALMKAENELKDYDCELVSIREKQVSYEIEAEQTESALKDINQQFSNQTNKCKQLQTSLDQIQQRHEDDKMIHLNFLRELYLLICGVLETPAPDILCWDDLAVETRRRVDLLIGIYRSNVDRVHHLEAGTMKIQQSMTDLQRTHENSVERLNTRCREKEVQLKNEFQQLKNQSENYIRELEMRLQESQQSCDEAWVLIRTKDGVECGLQDECRQLKEMNESLGQSGRALTCACTLLLSLLYPLIRSRDELIVQRVLLEKMVAAGEGAGRQLRMIVNALDEEFKNSSSNKYKYKSFKYIHPLIRFRIVVVAVVSMNRLKKLNEKSNKKLFVCKDNHVSNHQMLAVVGKCCEKKKNAGVSNSSSVTDWLSSIYITRSIQEATRDVTQLLNRDKEENFEDIKKEAKNSFINLIRLSHTFFPSYLSKSRVLKSGKSSLIFQLHKGLDRVIEDHNLIDDIKCYSFQHSIDVFRKYFLTFTSRLRKSEIERLQSRNHKTRMSKELKMSEKQIDDLKGHVTELNKNCASIDVKKVTEMRKELDSALNREKRAQKLLQEQNNKIKILEEKVEKKTSVTLKKDQSLDRAVDDLNKVKIELRKNCQMNRQLAKQVERLEKEKKDLEILMKQAEEALKKAAGEKNSIANYFQTIEEAFNNINNEDQLQTEVFLLRTPQILITCFTFSIFSA